MAETPDLLDAFLESVRRHELIHLRMDYEGQIAALNRRVEAIDTLLALTPDTFSNGSEAPPPPDPETIEKEDLSGLDPTVAEVIREMQRPGLAEAIMRIMSPTPGLEWTSDLLLGHLMSWDWAPRGKTPKNSVAATLSRLRAEGKMKRVRPGVYTLAHSGQDSPPAATERGEQQRLVEEGR